MKGDFSRLSFDPQKHYSGVRLQQGRVQLDADWNEQLDITAHRIETEITDFIGQSGAPDGNTGFEITIENSMPKIGKGRYYVDGMLIENDADVDYTSQPDYPGATLPTDNGIYLAYLDIWQRHISALEDPTIREVALGGPDTATRIKNVWQVKLHKISDDPELTIDPKNLDWKWAVPISSGQLHARVVEGATLENLLYRVEIHQPGKPDTATFKWSRDNGARGARVVDIVDSTITLSSSGPGWQAGQWIEVSDDIHDLGGQPGLLVKITDVKDRKLIVNTTGVGDLWSQFTSGKTLDTYARLNTRVRRWDSNGATPIRSDGKEETLENGITISFSADAKVTYKSGDYWLIPARTLTSNIDWPCDGDGAMAQPPHGIQHHYAAIHFLKRTDGEWSDAAMQAGSAPDQRRIFNPLTTGLVSKQGDTIEGDLTVQGSVGIGIAANEDIRLAVGGNINIDGALTITGKVNGRDVSKDGSTLDQHLTKKNNPHAVTATQLGALSSLAGVSNPGGNIDLEATGALTIKADPNTKKITLTVNALSSLAGVSNPGGNIDLEATGALTIKADPNTKKITLAETHSGLQNNPHKVTLTQVLSASGGTITGDVTITGKLGTNGRAPNSGYPTHDWQGGVHTWDVYANGSVLVGNETRANIWLDNTGHAYKVGGGSWSADSDIVYKQNIAPLEGALEQLLRLRGVTFEWKDPRFQGNLTGVQMGLIAQEVEPVFPQWVGTNPDGYKNLTIRGFEALTIEAFRDLMAEIAALKAEITTLKQQLLSAMAG